jgi:hypothetical protein
MVGIKSLVNMPQQFLGYFFNIEHSYIIGKHFCGRCHDEGKSQYFLTKFPLLEVCCPVGGVSIYQPL